MMTLACSSFDIGPIDTFIHEFEHITEGCGANVHFRKDGHLYRKHCHCPSLQHPDLTATVSARSLCPLVISPS
ncbi:hypothetical protein E2C01_096369 [Portunus trituberculatus]|uniref:Uncharacterized protein n=1 Tax=Portunus trituberculatus TaxID=210409 RepID=A0A5B7K2L3_PORTR|nr:hypothetical protein [Portunus trituberculatus]